MLSRLSTAAFNGIRTERNTAISSSADSPTTTRTKIGSRLLTADGEVVRGRRRTTDQVRRPGLRLESRQASSSRSRSTSSLVAASCGADFGNASTVEILPSGLGCGGVTAAMPGSVASVWFRACAAAWSSLGDDHQRTVEARPESLRPAGRTPSGWSWPGRPSRRPRTRAACSSAGSDKRDQRDRPEHQRHPRPALHPDRQLPPPVARRTAPLRGVLADTPLDPLAEQREQSRQQTDRGQHRRQHGQRDAERNALQGTESQRQQTEQRDHHGAAGEHHRAAGGVQGNGRRGLLGRSRPSAVHAGSGRRSATRSRCRRRDRPASSPAPCTSAT